MPIELVRLARKDKVESEDYEKADKYAAKLLEHLNLPDTLNRITKANTPGASSGVVQAIFETFAAELGFKSECSGLFANYPNKALRPDYYLPIGDTGILLEVERGKTTINNMDLLDFWKCHLCEKANYLFLLVPRELRQNEDMSPRREFNAVTKRMSAFFEPRNYTNVYGLWIFGY